MRREPRIYKKNPRAVVENISIDTQLLTLIRNREIPKDLKTKSLNFIDKYIFISKVTYPEIIDTFFDKYEFNPSLLERDDVLNSDIGVHPSILWNLQRIKNV
ncbi:MAG: hypothetical protein KKC68_02745 [Candidatus Thermoplasmatota archaeon]|nr:hypothetical protein [Candidatus Thermoplasmatota archaeon]MBU1940671.1 hypothetical protein [Candidatus Thermoplasmatota archaeon]